MALYTPAGYEIKEGVGDKPSPITGGLGAKSPD